MCVLTPAFFVLLQAYYKATILCVIFGYANYARLVISTYICTVEFKYMHHKVLCIVHAVSHLVAHM